MNTIANNWQAVTLGQICEYRYGFTAKSHTKANGIPYLRITDMTDERTIKEERVYASISGQAFNKFKLEDGDILIARTGSVGKSVLFEKNEDYVFASYLIRFRPDINRIIPKFLFYVLDSSSYWEYVRKKTTVAAQSNINAQSLSNFEFRLPPLDVQRSIVKKLDHLYHRINNNRKEILYLQNHKSQLVKLYHHNVIGFLFLKLISREGQEVSLGDYIIDIKLGTNQRAIPNATGVPVLRMPNIKDGYIDYTNLKYTRFTNSELEKYKLQPYDVLVNRTNSPELVGKSAVFDKNETFAFASYLIRLRLDTDHINPYYLSYYINSPMGRKYIESVYVKTAGQANINSEHLKSMPVRLLPASKQKLVVQQMSKMERDVIDMRNRLNVVTEKSQNLKENLDNIFRSIINKALSDKLLV